MIRWCLCNTTAATASWASVDLDGFLGELVGRLASRRAAGSTKGQEGGRKRQPAWCSRKTQDKFAIASMARKLLHRCTGAQARVVEIYIFICAYAYICTYMYVYIHMHMYIYMYLCIYVCVCVCMYIYIYVYTYTYIYVHVYMYIYMYIYEFICILQRVCMHSQVLLSTMHVQVCTLDRCCEYQRTHLLHARYKMCICAMYTHVYMLMYMYIYIYVYACIYIYVCMYIRIYAYICGCVYVCMCMYMCMNEDCFYYYS